MEMMGNYIDSLKFAGGSFSLIPEKALRELIELCHSHEVLVSTGGFIEQRELCRDSRRARFRSGDLFQQWATTISTSAFERMRHSYQYCCR
jgi:phosphosulfolactate synthase (CoM biosynthesis protein A)